jgi:hypothetical protein
MLSARGDGVGAVTAMIASDVSRGGRIALNG